MPELPDVEVFRRYADATALHQRISAVDARDAKVLRDISRRRLERELCSGMFRGTERHGKYLGLQLDSGAWLVLHFGMTGLLRYYKHEKDEPEHARLLITFSNGYHLAYVNQRRIGTIRLAADFARFVKQQELGPDALGLDAHAFRELLAQNRGTVKGLLMKQAAIAGVGNIYADEILYHAGIHPKSRLRQFDDQAAGRLHRALQHVLRTAIDREAEPDALPRSWLLPQRRGDERCPKGHGRLKKTKISGRTTYYCPRCQPLPRSRQ